MKTENKNIGQMQPQVRQRHKWSGKHNRIHRTANEGGSTEQCIRCGYIREYVKGIATYYRDDTVIDRYAPPCDGREVA